MATKPESPSDWEDGAIVVSTLAARDLHLTRCNLGDCTDRKTQPDISSARRPDTLPAAGTPPGPRLLRAYRGLR